MYWMSFFWVPDFVLPPVEADGRRRGLPAGEGREDEDEDREGQRRGPRDVRRPPPATHSENTEIHCHNWCVNYSKVLPNRAVLTLHSKIAAVCLTG